MARWLCSASMGHDRRVLQVMSISSLLPVRDLRANHLRLFFSFFHLVGPTFGPTN
jgi:hypothetical protein